MILFYDHLVDKTTIIVFIDKLSIQNNHKGKLKQLIDDIILQGLIDLILTLLPQQHHQKFLSDLHLAPYDPQLITFLKEHAREDIEEHLSRHAEIIMQKIKLDLESIMTNQAT